MCGCLDRERDKRRSLEQLSYSKRPILKQSNEFTNYRQIQSQSTKSQHVEIRQPRSSLLKYSQISGKQGNQSVRSDNQSYLHINQNSQFILLQKGELRQFLKQTVREKIRLSVIYQIQNDITGSQIGEQIISNSNFHKLYMDVKDLIGQPDKRQLGLFLRTETRFQLFIKISHEQYQ